MQKYAIGDILFMPGTGELVRNAHEVRLEPKAAAVLELLCANPGAVMDRRTLLDRCWGEDGGSDEALTQAVAQIRRALAELDQPATAIQTYPKRGYRLNTVHSTAAVTSPPARESLRRRKTFATSAAVIMLLGLVWASTGHAPRHFIRHQLGLHEVPVPVEQKRDF